MEVVQVGFHLDRDHRDPEDLLKAWPSLPGLARAVAGCGVQVTVVWSSHRDATFSMDGVTYVFASERPALLRRGTAGTRPVRAPASQVLDQVTGVRPDLVHVHGLTVPIHARHLKRRLPRVKILAQDHADRPPRRWRRPLERKRMKAYDAVAFTAREQVAPFIRTRMISSTVPVFEVPESSTDFGPADRVEARRRTGIYGDPCLVWLGHLDGNKDPLTVLEGLSGAVSHLPDPHLWCSYREAPLLEAVRGRIETDRVLRGRVHLLGPLKHDDVEVLLQGADALVQGSHREGSGFAVLEAMACGVTPVVTDIPSFRRLAGNMGLLWRPGDAFSCQRALLRLLDGDSEERRIQVRRRFERELSWSVLGERLAGIYRILVKGSGRWAGAQV